LSLSHIAHRTLTTVFSFTHTPPPDIYTLSLHDALPIFLAMQGAFAEHKRALEASGARTRLVKNREDLEGLEGLVLPGGESTTMTMLMERVGLLEPLRDAITGGL